MKSPDVVLAFWKSGPDGLPANGGKCKTPAYPGMVQEEKGPLRICTSEALHATMVPDEWSGDRVWIVALHGEVQFQENKCASLRREIVGEVFQ